ncbi:MAG: XylR N-terminal domain-containing protein, partial [Vicinamibacteraceae bacterium]
MSMPSEDLTLPALFHSPQAGVHEWVGHRAIIIDTAIVGFSRRAMSQVIGPVPMKQLLVRSGFVQGWRSASGLIRLVDPLTPHPVGESVQRLLTLLGMAHATSLQGDGVLHFAITLERSCEAEEHRRHCGPSAEPVCWVACGFVSGYMTRATARLVVCREHQCVAAGESTCRLYVDVRPDSAIDATADPCADETSAHLVQHLA